MVSGVASQFRGGCLYIRAVRTGHCFPEWPICGECRSPYDGPRGRVGREINGSIILEDQHKSVWRYYFSWGRKPNSRLGCSHLAPKDIDCVDAAMEVASNKNSVARCPYVADGYAVLMAKPQCPNITSGRRWDDVCYIHKQRVNVLLCARKRHR